MKNFVLITGASSGIGYELAKLFAKDGYNLILTSRKQNALNNVAAELSVSGIQVEVFPKDLFSERGAFELYDEIKARGLEVNILVNDAGQGQYGEFIDTEIQRELDIIQLNISSLVVLTKLFVKDMVARGEGKILNVASIASKLPGPYQSVYHATKAFVHSFSEALRVELKDKGIVVTSLLPGATDTDFFNKAEMQNSKAVQDEDQLSKAEDVAKDGYEALMAGKDMVVSGAMNKMQVAMSNITPDEMVAEKVKKQQEPVDEEKKKNR